MSTAVSVDLTGLSLSELTDQAIALGGDYPMAQEIGHPRYKKTWIKLIERLTALDVEVLPDESEPAEEVHHESRREMMIAEVERTRSIFEPEPVFDSEEPGFEREPDFNSEEPGFEPEPVFNSENEYYLREIEEFTANHEMQSLQSKVLANFLMGEVEDYFGDLSDIETWRWAEKFATVEKVLKESSPFYHGGFIYEKQKGYFGDYFKFKCYHQDDQWWLELHRLPYSKDLPFPIGTEAQHYYMLFFPTKGHDEVDMDGDICLNDADIIIYDNNRDGNFPLVIQRFKSESLTVSVGDTVTYKSMGVMPELRGEILEIYFSTIERVKTFSPSFRVSDPVFMEKNGREFWDRINISEIVGKCDNAVDLPPPPPPHPPIVQPIPTITPVAPWEKCNSPSPGSDRRECDAAITQRGSGRKSGTICHFCEGTGNILNDVECLKCDGKGYLSISDKVLFTAQEAVQLYVKKVSEQVRYSMVTLPIEQVKVMAKELLAADLLAGSERNLGGISKAIDIAMKYAPAVLPPFPWMKLKHRQAFLAVEKLDGYDFPFSNYYVGQLPYWQEVYLYLFPCCNDAEKFLNTILICGDFAVLEVG